MSRVFRTGLLATMLGTLSIEGAHAQVALYSFAQSAGTFTALSGGTTSTATGDISTQTGITFPGGFSFVFNGASYTSFGVSTDGSMAFGSGTPGQTTNALSGSSGRLGVHPLWDDNATATIKYDLLGTAPNRTFVIEWSGVKWKYNAATANRTFQVRLQETTNAISIVYGAMDAPGGSAITASIGLTGSASADFVSVTPGSPATVSTSTANNSINSITGLASGTTYTFSPPTCYQPSIAAVVPNVNSAQVSLTAPTFGTTPVGYNYQYRTTAGPGAWVGPFPSASATINVTGLAAGTGYDVQVQSNCGSGDLSVFTATTSFTTLCAPVNSPITENFEGVSTPNLPTCWNKVSVGGSTVQTTGSGTPIGTKQAQLTAPSSAATANRTILASPLLAELGSGMPLQLRFRAKSSSGTPTLLVGTVNNVGPNATFTPIQLALPLTTTFQDFTVSFTSYSGSNSMIAFRHGQDESGSGTTIYLDNVVWEAEPACPTPSALQASTATNSSALITFSPNGSNNVDVVYGATGFNPAATTPQATGVTGSSYTITGLTPSTTYDVYIRSTCGVSGTSSFIGPVSVTTQAAPINVNVSGPTPTTFTSIIGQPGTVAALGSAAGASANVDDELTAATNLGFTFNYLGTNFTQFKASSNGFVTFNTALTSTGASNDLSNTTFANVLAPLWDDLYILQARTNSGVYYQLSGTPGSQVLTVEWANMSMYQFADANFSFQLKIYEATGNIEYLYGNMTFFLGNVAKGSQYSYSIGLNGSPVAGKIMSQQLENTRWFANSAKNDLSIQPACQVKYTFTQNTAYASYSPVVAAAPANDQCGAAQALSINNVTVAQTVFCTTYTSALATASSSGGTACTGGNADDDVWFTFITSAAASTNVNVRVGGSYNYDAVVQIYQGNSCGALSLVQCVDATGQGLSESYTITAAPANTRYYVRVYHKGVGTGGNGTFVIDVFGVPSPPANNECAAATLLTTGSACTTTNADASFATASASAPTVCSGTPDDDVWFKFVAGSSAERITVAGSAGMTPVVQLMSGTCGSLTALACQAGGTNGATVSIAQAGLTVGSTYYVRVFHAGTGFGSGTFTICVQDITPVGNDEPAQAGASTAYSLLPSLTCSPTNGTTVNAFGPSAAAPAAPVGTADDDVFYSFVPSSTSATITVVGGTGFDAVVQVLSGTPGSFTSVDYVDDSGVAATEELTVSGLTPGQRYYIRVYDYYTAIQGTFTICVQQFPVPGNDEPTAAGAATPYSLTVGTTCTPTAGYTNSATASASVPAAPTGTADDDVWYSFVPTSSGPTITVAGQSTIDAVVVLYSGTPGALTQVAYADNTVSGGTEEIEASGLTTGQRYYVRVYGWGASSSTQGQFTICVTQGPKSIQTITATQVTGNVVIGTQNNAVLRLDVRVKGATGSLPFNSVNVTAVNTANADVTNVKLWVSTSTTFSPATATLLRNTTLTGSTASFSGLNYDLASGYNYFYVTYNIAAGATIGNTVDAQVAAGQININGTTYPATALNPTGSRTIQGPPPAFDDICGAVVLPVAVNGANVTYQQFNNQGATTGPPAPSCQANYANDVWFRVQVPATRNLYLSVINSTTAPITTDQVMDVFSSSNNLCSGTLSSLSCNDDGGVSTNPALAITAIPSGISYVFVRVAIWSSATVTSGNFQIAASDRPLFTGGSSPAFDTGGPTAANFFPQFEVVATLQGQTITVPAGLTNNPVVSSNQTIGGIVIMPGASLALNGTSVLTLGNGGFVNRGTFTQATGATVRAAGTAAVSLGNAGLGQAAVTFENLSVGPNGASLAGPVNVRRVLTLDGTLTTQGKKLTLLSDASATAMVVNNTGGAVVGAATVQRYIDPSISVRDTTYRHLSSPVTTNLADLGTTTPYYVVRVNPTWNVDTTSLPFPTIFGYDQSRIFTARPRFVDGYFSPNSVNDPMQPLVGYSALMRDGVNPDFVGTLQNGPYTRSGLDRGSLVNQGWHLLGNPYPAPIDWSLVATSQTPGMNSSISVLRSTSPNSANYVSYVNGIGSAQYVPMGQGFFMRTAAVGVPGSVNLDNADRVTTYQNPAHYRTAQETRPVLKLTLVQSGLPVAQGDETFVYFENGATANLDQYYDAYKLRSTGLTPSVFTVAGNEEVAINGLPVLNGTQETLVPLGVQVGVSGSYKLNVAEIINFGNTPVVLRDAVTGTEQDLTQNPMYAFTMDANFRGSRFTLVFNPQGRVTGLPALAGAQLAVFPNPAAQGTELTVRLTGVPASAHAVGVKLVDAVGRVIMTSTLPVMAGEANGAINTRSLSKGVYILKLAAGDQSVTRRVVIE